VSKNPTREKTNSPERLQRFFEELSWLLSSNSGLDFKSLPSSISSVFEKNHRSKEAVGGYVSSNPNKHFLVGVLPRLFTDSSIFPTNDDIAEFAQSVMNVSIPRFHKKSRYELIGHIVCQTDSLDDNSLDKLAKALEVLVKNEDSAKALVINRKSQFGWNDVIQSLVSEQSP
jgi:hypothetical protein